MSFSPASAQEYAGIPVSDLESITGKSPDDNGYPISGDATTIRAAKNILTKVIQEANEAKLKAGRRFDAQA